MKKGSEKEMNTCVYKKQSLCYALELNIQKTKIMVSGPITSWQIDRETVEKMTLYFWGLQNHCRW